MLIKISILQQIDLFGTSLQQLKIAQKKYGDSRQCVETMQEMKEAKPALIPLTNSVSFKLFFFCVYFYQINELGMFKVTYLPFLKKYFV